MADIGLFYVGAVLILNGIVLLGSVTARAAAPLNLLVGALQVVVPTYLAFTSAGDREAVLAAGVVYLFGFTYLWVGINSLAELPNTGLGWFSLFVAVTAAAYALHLASLGPGVFVVIWLLWAILWALFFLVFALDLLEYVRLTAWLAVVAGIATAALPASLSLTGHWVDSAATTLIAAVLALIVLAVLTWTVGPHRSRQRPKPRPPLPAATVHGTNEEAGPG